MALFFCGVIGTLPTAVLAEGHGPELGGNAIFRLGYNGVYDADGALPTTNDFIAIMIASPELRFSSGATIKSELRLEDVAPPMEDRFFDEEGLFVRKLFADVQVSDQFSVQVGKFTPSFSFASLVTPGMYGNNYNKEIELIERVGFGARYRFQGMNGGTHVLSAATFFDDTSLFSDSFGESRGNKSRADGGASNTESLESFALSLEGSELQNLPDFTYKLGLLHQARGEDGSADENGFLLAAMQSWSLDQDRRFTWIAEAAPIWNFDGSEDDALYLSGGLVYEQGPWTAVLSGTYRKTDRISDDDFNDYSVQTSIDYQLKNGLSLALAHEFLRADNIRSRRIGVRLSRVIQLGGQ
ncbi:MAG: hypothetical protein AAGB07_00110 [Pseudomonadota bacterium]